MEGVRLILLDGGGDSLDWGAGQVVTVGGNLASVRSALDDWGASGSEPAALCWDATLGRPPGLQLIGELLATGWDVWHAGLRLGMGGRPHILASVTPTWMLQADPNPEVEATSWRLSLRACLVRREVVMRLGGLPSGFRTLEIAGLEMGHRWIRHGARMRHVPGLLGPSDAAPPSRVAGEISGNGVGAANEGEVEDALRFVRRRHGRRWLGWAAFRAVWTRQAPFRKWLRAWWRVRREPSVPAPPPLRQPAQCESVPEQGVPDVPGRGVTVLIPTVDRYPYLKVLLGQLGKQTLPVKEVVVVDQTRVERRETSWVEAFPELPLRVVTLEVPGQCSSRNRGLRMATGEMVLFLDDDDEVGPDLVERHLRHLDRTGAGVSCGVADEVGAGPLPPEFRLARMSDVFPTNNTMIRREVLERSGLFDLAYDRGQRADGDLGMRLYLSGAKMLLDPTISVLHHHAPAGGLRTHGARVVTRAGSRRRLFQRHLASVWDIYRGLRYFPRNEVREMLWINAVGTLSGEGGGWRRALRMVLALVSLPHTVWVLHRRWTEANDMLGRFPQIPQTGEREE